jgi:hypothetical protein
MQHLHLALNPVSPWGKKNSIEQEEDFFTRRLNLKFKNKPVKWCIWSKSLCGAETWTLGEVDQK